MVRGDFKCQFKFDYKIWTYIIEIKQYGVKTVRRTVIFLIYYWSLERHWSTSRDTKWLLAYSKKWPCENWYFFSNLCLILLIWFLSNIVLEKKFDRSSCLYLCRVTWWFIASSTHRSACYTDLHKMATSRLDFFLSK